MRIFMCGGCSPSDRAGEKKRRRAASKLSPKTGSSSRMLLMGSPSGMWGVASVATPHIPEGDPMSNIRLLDPVFGDNFDAALRRFFSPALSEGEQPPHMKMRIDVTKNDKAY